MVCGIRKGAEVMYDGSICGDCPGMYEFIRLIDCLVKDICHLESETVCTRYELSRHLPHPYDDELRGDIVSDLAGRYGHDPAYQVYMKLMYDNRDPMQSDEYASQIRRLAHGRHYFKR